MTYSVRPLVAPERPSRDHIAAARTLMGSAEKFERRVQAAAFVLVAGMGVAGAIAWRSAGQATAPLLVALGCFVTLYVLQAWANVRSYRAKAVLDLIAFSLRAPAEAAQAAARLERPLRRYEALVLVGGAALLTLPLPRVLGLSEPVTLAWVATDFLVFAAIVAGAAPHAIRQFNAAAATLRK